MSRLLYVKNTAGHVYTRVRGDSNNFGTVINAVRECVDLSRLITLMNGFISKSYKCLRDKKVEIHHATHSRTASRDSNADVNDSSTLPLHGTGTVNYILFVVVPTSTD